LGKQSPTVDKNVLRLIVKNREGQGLKDGGAIGGGPQRCPLKE